MDIFNRQFGLLIAYLLPGFIALAGSAPLSPTVAGWLRADQTAPFGAPLYVLLAATAAGMIVSCFRWIVIDRLVALTGVRATPFNTRALEASPAAFNYLVEQHYRFHQFYGNTIIAVVWTYGVYRWLGTPSVRLGMDIAMLILCAVLFAGSRDALEEYRERSSQLAGPISPYFSEGEANVTNGIDHHAGSSNKADKAPAQQKTDKPQAPAKPQPAKGSTKTER
jgi:hypothetical protein